MTIVFIGACFDIFDDRRRPRVSNLLEDHGLRVQHSVFECHLAASELRTLKKSLAELIDEYEDHIRYYSLCNKDQPAGIKKQSITKVRSVSGIQYRK